MNSLQWIAGAPLLALTTWSHQAQAADILVTFNENEVGKGPVPKATALLSEASAADAHLLNFVPPLHAAPPPSLQLSLEEAPTPPPTSSQTTSSMASSIASATPLPLPDVPIPSSSEVTAPPPPLTPAVAALFEGDDNSLVAVAVGHAEGTRTANGKRTLAYYGHVDPGNQAWNQGTFSYQHTARSPQEADQKQLARLKQQTKTLHNLAFQKGIVLTQIELLNGIDLANQAPQAALDRGYIDWLAQAKVMGLQADEAILWARTRSFLDPDTGRWNAPGLGNSVQSISQDQGRRQQAIARAIAHYAPTLETSVSVPMAETKTTKTETVNEAAIDFILLMDYAD